jgi:hypothetical protein
VANDRRTSTSPAKKGASQETTFLTSRFSEETDSIMMRPKLEKTTGDRGEDKIAAFPVPY